MYRVLLPVDPNTDRAMAAAEAVASFPNAADAIEVTVLNVFEKREVQDLDGGRISSDQVFEESEAPASVAEATDFLEEAGVDVSTRREHGDPVTIILETAAEDFDQIVMSGRKRGPVGKAIFGSVTQSVMLNSPIPVTFAGTS